MAYTKQTWTNGDSSTPLSAERLNHIEDGIAAAAAIKGENGQDGKDGKDGAKGADGKSAFQIAKDAGFSGDEAAWLASLKGKDGKDGAKGADGKDATPQFTADEVTKIKALIAEPAGE